MDRTEIVFGTVAIIFVIFCGFMVVTEYSLGVYVTVDTDNRETVLFATRNHVCDYYRYKSLPLTLPMNRIGSKIELYFAEMSGILQPEIRGPFFIEIARGMNITIKLLSHNVFLLSDI